MVSTTKRGHRSRGKFGVHDPAAFCRVTCCIATNTAVSVVQAESCGMDDWEAPALTT